MKIKGVKIIRIYKKGQGEFVAYVLLIGMAVGLAVLVGRWSIGQSQSASENFVGQSELQETCGQIQISAYPDCTGTSTSSTKIKLDNRGYLTIPKARIQISGCTNNNANKEIDEEINLKPQNKEPKEITVAAAVENCENVLVMPMIKIKEQEFGCSDKRVEVSLECPQTTTTSGGSST